MDKFAVKVIKKTVSHLPWELSCIRERSGLKKLAADAIVKRASQGSLYISIAAFICWSQFIMIFILVIKLVLVFL